MRSLLLLVAAAVPVLAVACGGRAVSIDDGTSQGSSGSSGSSGTSGGASGTSGTSGGTSGTSGGTSGTSGSSGSSGDTNYALGSYDLMFAQVTPDPKGNVFGTPPSQGHSFRVDLTVDKASVSALVTPRWGTASVYTVQSFADRVVLTGKGSYFASYVTDSWETITLGRDASGQLAGTFTASGNEQASGGDVVSVGAISAKGTFTTDALAPELRIPASSPLGPANALLPWDAVAVTFAEPVQGPAQSFDGFTLLSGAALPVDLAWTADPLPSPYAGVLTGAGRRASFEPLGSSKITVGSKLTDYAGHGLVAVNQPLAFLDLPVVAKQHALDGATPTVGTWGATTLLDGSTASNPMCETGGCAQLGVFEDGYCQQDPLRLGLAARVDMTAGSSIAVRYRVMVEDKGGGAAPYLPAAFTLQTATPMAEPKILTVNPAQGDYKKLPAAVQGMAWATDWATATVTLAKGGEAGIAIVGGAGPNTSPCGLVPAPSKAIVVIDSIAAQ